MTEVIWVKRGLGISAFGLPLAVMAAGKQGQQHWRGEYYILLGGQYPGLLYQAFTVRAVDVPESIAVVDAEYMRVELDQQVVGRLSVHCFDLYEKTEREGFLKGVDWEDGEKLDILRAWIRNQHHESIKTMRASTNVDALKLLLRDVEHLPVVTISGSS
jgi:hypothetical protein